MVVEADVDGDDVGLFAGMVVMELAGARVIRLISCAAADIAHADDTRTGGRIVDAKLHVVLVNELHPIGVRHGDILQIRPV